MDAASPLLWSYESTNSGYSTLLPAIATDGTIYWPVGRHLEALTPAGTLKWRLSLPLPDGEYGASLHTPTIRSDGIILLSTRDRWGETNFHAVNPVDGSIVWSKSWVPLSIAQGLNATFVLEQVSIGFVLRKVDANSNEEWVVPAPASSKSLFLGPEGNLYVTASGIFAYNQQGHQLWSLSPLRASNLTAINEEGILYASSPGGAALTLNSQGAFQHFLPAHPFAFLPSGNLIAFRAETTEPEISSELVSFTPAGELLWSSPAIYHRYSTAAVAANGTTYFVGYTSSARYAFYLVGLAPDGAITQQTPLPEGGVYGPPLVSPSGTIYLGGRFDSKNSSVLFAFAGDSPLSTRHWPTPGRDARHTRSLEKPFYASLLQPSVSQTSAVLKAALRSSVPSVTATFDLGSSPDLLNLTRTTTASQPDELLEFHFSDLEPMRRYYYRLTLSTRTTVVTLPVKSFETAGPTEKIELTQEALRFALLAGGRITFATNGTIAVTNTIEIHSDSEIVGNNGGVTLDGQGMSGLFSIQGANVTLSGLRLVNATTHGTDADWNSCTIFTNAEPAFGGAIFASNATLRIESCTFSNVVAHGGNGGTALLGCDLAHAAGGYGGAVYVTLSDATVSNSHFENCFARGGKVLTHVPRIGYPSGPTSGGAIAALDSTIQIANCRFTNNSAPSSGARFYFTSGTGGAIFLAGSPAVIRDSQFAANLSGGGGAIFTDSPLTLAGCSFDSNRVGGGSSYGGTEPGLGGAVCNVSTNTLAISQCTFTRNSATGGSGGSPGGVNPPGPSLGGAVYSFPGFVTLTNCSLAFNEIIPPYADFAATLPGPATGAAIYCSSAILEYTTIASNRVTFPLNTQPPQSPEPGSYIAGICSTNGSVSLHATLLANEGSNAWGTFSDLGFNLSSDNSITFSHPSSRAATDPRLGPFQIPDGFRGYLVPLPDSPAIDAGDPAAFPETDLRGLARPQGSRADIGAIEIKPQPILLTEKRGSSLVLSFTSPLNTPGTLEHSADLIHWQPLQPLSSGETANINLENAPASQFYRILQE